MTTRQSSPYSGTFSGYRAGERPQKSFGFELTHYPHLRYTMIDTVDLLVEETHIQ